MRQAKIPLSLKRLPDIYLASLRELLTLGMFFRAIIAYALSWMSVSPHIQKFERAYYNAAARKARWEIESPHAEFVVYAFVFSWIFFVLLRYYFTLAKHTRICQIGICFFYSCFLALATSFFYSLSLQQFFQILLFMSAATLCLGTDFTLHDKSDYADYI